jgi:hypothetical protein
MYCTSPFPCYFLNILWQICSRHGWRAADGPVDCLGGSHVLPQQDDVTVETAIALCPPVWRNAIQCMCRWRHTTVHQVFITRCWAAGSRPMDCLGDDDVVRDLTIEEMSLSIPWANPSQYKQSMLVFFHINFCIDGYKCTNFEWHKRGCNKERLPQCCSYHESKWNQRIHCVCVCTVLFLSC